MRTARAALMGAWLALGCGAAEPMGGPGEGRPPALDGHVSGIEAREAHVARLRAHAASFASTDPRGVKAAEQLAEGLIALAREYRSAAVAEDPAARVIAPPIDARARSRHAEELDLAPTETPALLARAPDALHELRPKARSLLIAADRAAEEGIRALEHVLFGPGASDASAPRLHASRARLLDELGQHIAARSDWYMVIQGSTEAKDLVEAWLAFAQWFAESGKREELGKALERSAKIATDSSDPALLVLVCARARDAGLPLRTCSGHAKE
jgi:hypothetical protein